MGGDGSLLSVAGLYYIISHNIVFRLYGEQTQSALRELGFCLNNHSRLYKIIYFSLSSGQITLTKAEVNKNCQTTQHSNERALPAVQSTTSCYSFVIYVFKFPYSYYSFPCTHELRFHDSNSLQCFSIFLSLWNMTPGTIVLFIHHSNSKNQHLPQAAVDKNDIFVQCWSGYIY